MKEKCVTLLIPIYKVFCLFFWSNICHLLLNIFTFKKSGNNTVNVEFVSLSTHLATLTKHFVFHPWYSSGQLLLVFVEISWSVVLVVLVLLLKSNKMITELAGTDDSQFTRSKTKYFSFFLNNYTSDNMMKSYIYANE